MVLITGNTYPHKEALKSMGGRWDAAAKGWRVPEGRADEARALVGGNRPAVAAPRSEAPRAAAGGSRWIAAVGDRVTVAVEVIAVSDGESEWGGYRFHALRDRDGNLLCWRSTSEYFQVGDKLTGKATVRKHGEFRGEKQTELTRCTLTREGEAPAPRASRSSNPPPVEVAPEAEELDGEYEPDAERIAVERAYSYADLCGEYGESAPF